LIIAQVFAEDQRANDVDAFSFWCGFYALLSCDALHEWGSYMSSAGYELSRAGTKKPPQPGSKDASIISEAVYLPVNLRVDEQSARRLSQLTWRVLLCEACKGLIIAIIRI
jgi:hypothetical protein